MEAVLYEGVIALMRSALKNEAVVLPESFSLKAALPMIRRHNLDNLALEGAVKSGISMDAPGMQELFRLSGKCLMEVQRQQAAIKLLLKAFEDNGIDHLPLKGVILRDMYPKPEFRTMGDADILIREEQYESVRSVMERLGYQFLEKCDNCYTWNSSALSAELHYCLFSVTNTGMYEYYRDPWRLAHRNGSGYCFHMTNEDAFIFLFVHMAKHYRQAGVGVRQLADLWVYRKAVGALDETYLACELGKMGLLDFYRNVMQTVEVWFEDRAPSDVTNVITEYVANSGVFGRSAQENLNRILAQSGEGKAGILVKIKSFWKMIWLPLEEMSYRYEILKAHPWMLPFCWIHRVFKIIFGRTDLLKQKATQMKNASAADVDGRRQMLDFVGIGTDFLKERE